jgi:cell division protein FtsB
MKLLVLTLKFLRNKFFLTTTSFVVWMLFFDRNDLFTQMERKAELREMKQSNVFYQQQIAENQEFSRDLQFNAQAIEKIAREKHLMKRDNEDLFLVIPMENK